MKKVIIVVLSAITIMGISLPVCAADFNTYLNDSKIVNSCDAKTKDGQLIYVNYVSNEENNTGWKLINNKWYFIDNNGIMKTGCLQSNSNWYYLDENGEMAVDTITPDGYKVDQSGKWDFGKPVSNYIELDDKIRYIRNPIEEFKTVEDAQKDVTFKVILPKEIPALFKMKYINTISRSIFQVCYSDGEKDILLRIGQGINNISGDYTEYKINDIIKVDDNIVDLSGNDKLINLATWKINDMSYSISVKNGMEKDDIIKIIKSTF